MVCSILLNGKEVVYNNSIYYESGYSYGEFEIVTDEELLNIISFEETENEYIELKVKDGSED